MIKSTSYEYSLIFGKTPKDCWENGLFICKIFQSDVNPFLVISLKLGKKYLNENNLEKAEKYLQIAAKEDNTEAQYILGIV